MTTRIPAPVYRNPILNADWPDPDAVQVDGVYYLIASSFNRVPGLPVLRSRNLVDWEHAGHALAHRPQATHYSLVRHGSGVWAPALRHHNGRFWIFYPDPDHGIFVLSAEKAEGPWTTPAPPVPRPRTHRSLPLPASGLMRWTVSRFLTPIRLWAQPWTR